MASLQSGDLIQVVFSSPGREHKEARGPLHGCDIMREPQNEEISPKFKGTGRGRRGLAGAGSGAAGRGLASLCRLQPAQLLLQPLQQGDLRNGG